MSLQANNRIGGHHVGTSRPRSDCGARKRARRRADEHASGGTPRIPRRDELFRAMAAAAMTCLVERTAMTRAQAAKDVARRLSRMGYKHPSGKEIKPAQIVAWREKMMTELAAENRAVGRYQTALYWVKDEEPQAALTFLLNALPGVSPARNPKLDFGQKLNGFIRRAGCGISGRSRRCRERSRA